MNDQRLDMKDFEFFNKWFKGNRSAIDMVALVLQITHVWDDLIDQDKPVTGHQINQAFFNALISLQRNDFYASNGMALGLLMEHGIRDWITANELEEQKNFEAAFVLRCSIRLMFIEAAVIIGGYSWGQDMAQAYNEYTFSDFSEYKAEFTE